ncbi:MAG TPA: lyase [Dehalococcoidia bacterium]|nr:lyase [Dehalococcoidia bacterium]
MTTAAATAHAAPSASTPQLQAYEVPAGSRPHDVAPAADGGVWYTAQSAGALGYLDPKTGKTREIPLGEGSSPHGVIVGPDGKAWITDSGLNSLVRYEPFAQQVNFFPLPPGHATAALNTAVVDPQGVIWFTGQTGIIGRFDPRTFDMETFDAPRGAGPYGITTTPDGAVFFASLAGNYLGRVDPASGGITVLEPPTAGQGARRAWADSRGRIWVSEWNAGQVGVFDPATHVWKEWRLPGENPQPYAVFVDEADKVWLSDFGANALVRFDPESETFESFHLPDSPGEVRQINGRPGEVWAAESAADKLVVIRY